MKACLTRERFASGLRILHHFPSPSPGSHSETIHALLSPSVPTPWTMRRLPSSTSHGHRRTRVQFKGDQESWSKPMVEMRARDQRFRVNGRQRCRNAANTRISTRLWLGTFPSSSCFDSKGPHPRRSLYSCFPPEPPPEAAPLARRRCSVHRSGRQLPRSATRG